MRKAIIFLAIGVLAASSASASLPWNEAFNYADGNITEVSAWTVHNGTLPTDVQILGGEAVLNSAAAPDVSFQFRASTEAGAADVIYASFKLKITGTQTSTGGYFAHFMNTGTFFAGRVFAALVDANTYKLGISTGSSTSTYWPVPLVKGVYYEIATRYDAGTGISTLWVDASGPGWATQGLSSPAGSIGTLISGFALRQSGGYGVATIDNLSVSVSSGIVATENSTWGAVKSLYR